MKPRAITLLSTLTLAVCGFLLLAPRGMAAGKDTLNASDVQFVKHAAAAGLAVVKLAGLGVQKASRADIKAFAAMIVTDHAKANAELTQLAATKGVELSAVIDPRHADTFQQLEKVSGPDFDKQFLAEMVRGHQKCVSSFEAAASAARDNDVKAYAITTLPVLKSHLGKALELSPTTSVTPEPDNTARNVRDRDPASTLTPLDQGSSKNDLAITAQIRRDVTALNNISVNAQNVKIITLNGRVTLRGPVHTAEEKSLIGAIADRIVRSKSVDNQLEVKPAPTGGN
ncbi:MAG: DUF4142 domain-containing protein [Prosthecobacter sp.]